MSNLTGIRYVVLLICSDVRDAHMCSSGTRARRDCKPDRFSLSIILGRVRVRNAYLPNLFLYQFSNSRDNTLCINRNIERPQ